MTATDTPEDWSIFFTLTDLTSGQIQGQPVPRGEESDREACLRRVLRPHDEAGFTGPDEAIMIQWRDALDIALGRINLREIRRELGLPYTQLPAEVVERLLSLFQSEAFLRYLNAYHYFGIRFVPFWPDFVHRLGGNPLTLQPPVCVDSNVPNSALVAPPALTTIPNAADIFQRFEALVRSDRTGDVDTALRFLDGFESPVAQPLLVDLKEPTVFELWLRGLRPETTEVLERHFVQLANGIAQWAKGRTDFYLGLTPHPTVQVRTTRAPGAETEGELPAGERIVSHPAAARLALADIYWIAKIFRADISSNATVAYQKNNWLHLLRFRATFVQDDAKVQALHRAEDVLRSVFDYVCDLIQNSVEVTEEDIENFLEARRAQLRPAVRRREDRPATTVSWRAAFDEELTEIDLERGVRHYRDPTLAPQPTTGDIAPVAEASPAEGATAINPAAAEATRKQSAHLNKLASDVADQVDRDHRWSRRLLGSPRPANLIGLAFSGGGIRSATLNLGVLEGLQELDLLRHFDYISTVSGGGFIGSWLVGNVRRSAHWLGRLTDWSGSIDHLRKYSNYLAPRTGMLSPDTLTIAITWLRNTLLIQLSSLVALFFLLTSALATMRIFLLAGGVPGLDFAVLGAAAVCVVARLWVYLGRLPIHSQTKDNWITRTFSVGYSAVLPAWIGATALTSRFWAGAANSKTAAAWPCLQSAHSFGDVLRHAWYPWWPLLLFSAIGFALLAMQTLQRNKGGWTAGIATICTGVLYLELAGIFTIFRSWVAYGDKANSFAFVFGPPLALLAFSACVLLLIGFSSKDTNEAQREWWTRYGTWLFLYGGSFLFVCGVALFGPATLVRSITWMRAMHHPLIPWTALLGSIGTVVGGLFAGKSSKTAGQGGSSKEQVLEGVARVGGVVFILGSFLLGSTVLYVLLFEIFQPGGAAIEHPLQVFCQFRWWSIVATWIATLFLVWLFSKRFEINIFGFSQFYRNRLVRCYLGATRWMHGARNPNPFMKFDFRDDMKLWRFRTDSPGEDPDRRDEHECDPYRGPFPLFNCSLNLAGSSDLGLNTRHGASFTLTPLRCGCDRPRVGYAPTYSRAADGKRNAKFADGVQLGQAVAISGAAVSSNMGYNTSSLVAFLLTMFNVRLGWWFPNPGRSNWKSRGLNSSLPFLFAELMGSADEKRDFINVSDGGHFENLGIYELVRRRCRLIVACDAECDPDLQFGSLGKMIRNCETDFGAEIDLNVNSLRPQADGLSLAHCAVGTIKYCTGEIGRLIYLKASMTGDEDVSIAQYRSQHPSFPHESTAKQFYSEDQFESYRRLGLEMVRASFKGNLPGDDPILIGERMFDVLTPDALSSDKFVRHAQALNGMWKSFGGNARLWSFMNELMAHSFNEVRAATQQLVRGIPVALTDEEFSTGLQLIQLMEDVFLDLRLDDYWEHPDYRGWAILFMRWARSPRFREVWSRAHRTFGIRFEYFCNANLGLVRDYPIARV
ncbi:MAG TPA: patatin-like phospholipase family protein [Acidobacteriaceae bacterium]|jgi:hypothetical protein|nr:patatin-like phospholipase family protein [Acidobacteriaceae bacterium]